MEKDFYKGPRGEACRTIQELNAAEAAYKGFLKL